MKSSTKQQMTVSCLGEFHLSLDGVRQPPLRPKIRELLALLLMARGGPCLRTNLESQLWLGTESEARKINLRTHLSLLRQKLHPQEWRIVSEGHTIRFDMAEVEVDVFTFQAAVQEAKQTSETGDIEAALALYTGPLLPTSKIGVIEKERDRLQALSLTELEALAETLVSLEQREHALKLLDRAFEIDPLRETTVGFMLHLLENDMAKAGDVMAKYRKAVQKAANYPVVSEHLEAQFQRIRAKHHRNRPHHLTKQKASLDSAHIRLDRIPVALQTLIGREEELQRLRTRLAQYRFVTLVGIGGVGKTRLAIEICRQYRALYQDGIVFTDLAGVSAGASQERIAEVIAAVMEIAGGTRAFVDTLVTALETRHMLLVLDNCEHLSVSCIGLIRVLLQKCTRLTLLVTSRIEFVSEFGEVVRIHALPIPPVHPSPTTEALRRLSTVQLFESIAVNRRPGFQITEENAVAIATICRFTEGLPLAIQLVASAGTFTWAELAQQLAEGFGAVELPEDPDLPEHSRTLLLSVEWSCRLLSSAEKALFYGAALFVGGWTPHAGDAILKRADSEFSKVSTLMEQLNAKSLVEHRELVGSSRYHMVRSIREYAHQCLLQSDQYAEIGQRHLDYYLEQAEYAANLKEGNLLKEALQALTWDQENLHAALDYSLATGQTEKALRMAAALARYWYLKGRHQEGHDWLERVLAISAGASAAIRRNALHGAGIIAYLRHDYDRADSFWSECLRISQEQDDAIGTLQAQGNLGNIAMAQEDY
ncbi:MAG: transcriptional activator domain protein, partial [Chthonomonadales bacterium]|nr:transcriptional activator domain protein [Chthonomonadales bacterium]